MLSHFSLQDALKAHAAGDYRTSEQMFTAICLQHPDNWVSWFHLASIEIKRERNAPALAYLYRALDLAPEQPAIWNNLGTTLRREHHVEKAKEALLKGAEINPEDADLWSNLCTLYVNEGDPELGLEYVNKALAAAPDHVNAQWNKSLLLLETGHLREGFELYPAGMKTGERMYRWPMVPRFDPVLHQGKRVLVYGEQGLGDEVMYLSLIPDLLRDVGSLVIECHPRLETLINKSFPEVTTHPSRKREVVDWGDDETFDAAIALGDIPRFYRKKPEDFPRKPYLKVDPALVHEYRHRLLDRAGPGPYLGIGWKGGYKKTRKDLRSIQLDEMAPIIQSAHEAGAKIISFQYTPEAEFEIRQFEQKYGIKIHHWPDIVCGETDYMKTAALLSNMDLAITVNTSLVHLAGALGKELWTLTPRGCAWRYWCWDEHMMWYESVTQYRAGKNKTWEPVLKQVEKDMRVKLDLLKSIEVAR